MEYIVSNVSFQGAKKIADHLWIKGNFTENNKCIYLIEGYIIDRKIKNVSTYCNIGLSTHYANGAYNIFYFDKKEKILEIKTDKRSVLSLYMYEKNGIFAYSNNPWELVKIFHKQISINEHSLQAQLLYFSDYHATRTLFTDISRIDGASYIYFDAVKNTKQAKRYWQFTYTPDTKANIQQYIEQVESDFSFYFDTIKEQNPNLIAGFGCSGGLDSRIIAHYVTQANIPCHAYVIGNEYPNHLLRSTTAKTSALVAECYKLSLKFIPYHADYILQSMMLDIRNDPFIYSQAFINPTEDLPSFDYMLAGDPGGLVYMSDYILSNDHNKLQQHAQMFIGYRQWGMKGIPALLRKVAAHLKIPYNMYANQGLLGLNKSTLTKVMDAQVMKFCQEELFTCINQFGGENNIETWIRIHDKINAKYQYSAGYSSINHTKRCYQLYYPFFYETISTFPPEYFRNKFFLKKFIEKINPALLNIPDQNLNKINGTNGHINRLLNRAELAIRGRGLNFLNLLHSPEYSLLTKQVFKRDNPIFYSIVDKKQLFKSGILHSYAGIQYLKMKMLVDIFYYNEEDILLNNKQFEKPEWQ